MNWHSVLPQEEVVFENLKQIGDRTMKTVMITMIEV